MHLGDLRHLRRKQRHVGARRESVQCREGDVRRITRCRQTERKNDNTRDRAPERLHVELAHFVREYTGDDTAEDTRRVKDCEKVACEPHTHAVCNGLNLDEIDRDEEAHEEQERRRCEQHEARVGEGLEEDFEAQRPRARWEPRFDGQRGDDEQPEQHKRDRAHSPAKSNLWN